MTNEKPCTRYNPGNADRGACHNCGHGKAAHELIGANETVASAELGPWSSVVGLSVMLCNRAGAYVGQLGIMGRNDEEGQREVGELVVEAINAAQNKPEPLPWRERDIRRGLILFRTSSNAHGFTNFSSLNSKVDALPQAAKDELSAIMVNMALGLSEKEVFRNGVVAARVAGQATQAEGDA